MMSCGVVKLNRCQSGLVSARKIILFPDHNIPGDLQPSVSIVSHGREPGEIAKIRETHRKSVRLDGFDTHTHTHNGYAYHTQ